jgi:dTDP-4-amino-4,6-dideoxygalactose transaminase
VRSAGGLADLPSFPEGIPFVRPPTPPLERVMRRLSPSYERGILTAGPLGRELEEQVATQLHVEHVVAVSTCTAGLMLVLRALEIQRPVLMPSFTFSATAHAAAWNGLSPRFVDCDAASFQVDPHDLERRIDGAGAIMATHVFGAPCPVERVEALGRLHGVPVVFDAAHAYGATRGDRNVGGLGDVEVFSMTPTKLVIAGEGGLVTTNRADVAEAVRIGRDYANAGDYDTRFVGLNARLSELHAATALESLVDLDVNLARRRAVAQRYLDGLQSIAGIGVQQVETQDRSTYKDFTIVVDEGEFGLARDALVAALRARGVDTRCYFSPPVHRQHAYRDLDVAVLPVTDSVASRVVSLPIYPDLGLDRADKIVAILVGLHEHADEVRATGPPYDLSA